MITKVGKAETENPLVRVQFRKEGQEELTAS